MSYNIYLYYGFVGCRSLPFDQTKPYTSPSRSMPYWHLNHSDRRHYCSSPRDWHSYCQNSFKSKVKNHIWKNFGLVPLLGLIMHGLMIGLVNIWDPWGNIIDLFCPLYHHTFLITFLWLIEDNNNVFLTSFHGILPFLIFFAHVHALWWKQHPVICDV